MRDTDKKVTFGTEGRNLRCTTLRYNALTDTTTMMNTRPHVAMYCANVLALPSVT